MTDPIDLVRTVVVLEVIERAAPAVIELVAKGPQGAAGTGVNVDYPLIADQVLSGHRVVRFVGAGRVDVVSSADPAQAGRAVGVSLNATVADGDVSVRAAGEIDDVSFAFVPGLPVYFDSIGRLTQVMPTSGFIQSVALAASSTKICLQLGPAIVLA